MSVSGVRRWLSAVLPAGTPLPERHWQARHRAILCILGLHAVGILGYMVWRGHSAWHVILDTAPIAALAGLASVPRLSRRSRAAFATLGSMASSAVLVHLSHGLIEMHFHFFVMLIVITFYQEWRTFLLAAGFVVAEHAVVGVVSPQAVYNHADAWADPVKWAAIHALFVAGAGAAAIVNWRLTEQAQEAERAMAVRLAHEASHDPLTGALNRRELDRRLAAPRRRDRADQQVLCFVDLDRFKIVNDMCGHGAGDLLLRQVTDLIHGELRAGDELARVGGDEFVVVLTGSLLDEAADIAERLRRRVAEHRFVHEGRSFTVGISVGVAAVDGDAPEAGQAALQAADAACYVAKHTGRGRVHVAGPNDERLDRQQRQANWAARLMSALETDGFVLYYQPIAEVHQTGTSYFGELLIRLPAGDGTMITPGAFLPAAERYHLLAALDRWVIRAAFSALAERPGAAAHLYAINLSSTSLADPTLPAFIRHQLATYRIAPSSICFEVTESVAVADLAGAAALITDLRALGCRFALDDFGNGLSSFTHLKRLPVDYLKIDGTFVRGMPDDPIDRAMVESVNRISHEMGLRTVAEFVENSEILQALDSIGIDYAQGWEIGRPVPFVAWLNQHTARPRSRRRDRAAVPVLDSKRY